MSANSKVEGHTPGPWSKDKWGTVKDTEGNTVRLTGVSLAMSENDEVRANRDLFFAGPDLLAVCERAYAKLGAISTKWTGRDSAEGQELLCALRDAICKATDRDAQDVQDDYANRHLTKANGAQS